MNYSFDIDKIASFLENFKHSLPILYKWKTDVKELVSLNILSPKEALEFKKVSECEEKKEYLNGLLLRKKIEAKLLELKNSDAEKFQALCLWIIKDWGGIKGGKEENNIKLIDSFKNKNIISFTRIASTSKIASFMYPKKYVIYDSRVAYSLNWIILAENAGQKFFPIPEGRNSKMQAFNMNVLIRLKNISNYKPLHLDETNKRSYINEKDKFCYIPKETAYTELNNLITQLSKKLWKSSEKSELLYLTEMLLFSIADKEIFNDLTNRLSISFK